jgi:soluble lytic murein transglycosylase-like protein
MTGTGWRMTARILAATAAMTSMPMMAALPLSLLGTTSAFASASVQSTPLAPPADRASTSADVSGISPGQIGACIEDAARAYGVPPIVLLILLHVEGGQPGAVSPDTNGTVDIGPMQINQIWLPTLARHWNATIPATYAAIKDNFCANVAGGAWILHRAIDDAHGHLWLGVSYYHSHSLTYEADYLRAVMREVRHLEAESRLHRSERP